MKQNMGKADRTIRVIVALALGLLWYQKILTGTLGYLALAVAAIFLVTSLAGTCPLYSLLGINTCHRKKTV